MNFDHLCYRSHGLMGCIDGGDNANRLQLLFQQSPRPRRRLQTASRNGDICRCQHGDQRLARAGTGIDDISAGAARIDIPIDTRDFTGSRDGFAVISCEVMIPMICTALASCHIAAAARRRRRAPLVIATFIR